VARRIVNSQNRIEETAQRKLVCYGCITKTGWRQKEEKMNNTFCVVEVILCKLLLLGTFELEKLRKMNDAFGFVFEVVRFYDSLERKAKGRVDLIMEGSQVFQFGRDHVS
jgi:hypothetical protein